jgi:hypothetical protein
MGAGCIGYTGRMIDKRTTQVEKSDRLIGNSGWVLLGRYSADLTAYPATDVTSISFTVPAPARGYKAFHVTYTEYKPVTNQKALMIDADVGGGYGDAYLGDAKWYIGHNDSASNAGAGWNSGNSGSSASYPGGNTGYAQNAMKMVYTGSSNGSYFSDSGLFSFYVHPGNTAYTKNFINNNYITHYPNSAAIKYGGGGYWNEGGNTITEIKLTTQSGDIHNGIFHFYAAK